MKKYREYKKSIKYKFSKKELILFILLGYSFGFITIYLFYNNVYISLLLSFGFVFLEPVYKEYLIGLKRKKILEEFRDFIYCISSSVSVGKTMRWAIVDSKKSLSLMYQYEESYLLKEIDFMIYGIENMNYSEEEVLDKFAERTDIKEIRDFADIYKVCVETGGNIAKVVVNTITILTDKMNIEREIKAIIAQRQFEGRIVSIMPIIILALLNVSSSDYLKPMYNTVAGNVIMTGCLACFIGAGIWIFKILDWK